MTIQQFFPFSPDYMTWEDWNGNLIMFYSEEPIPMGVEDDWKEVARNVAQLPTFTNYPVSGPETYGTWQEWANDFTQIVNGPTR